MLLNNLLKQKRTLIMGVMNLTPDSFSNDGLSLNSPRANLRHAKDLVRLGADILDIGGESTRPGALQVSAQDELKRILPTVRLVAKNLDVPVSVDSYKPHVIKACLEEGATIVNNIEGLTVDPDIISLVRKHKAFIVLMHMRGNPRTMQTKTIYKDVVADVIKELRLSVENCLEMGIKKDRIIVDPGIGFSKTPDQNLQILRRLNELNALKLPVLVGTSRKSFIGKVLNKKPDARIFGTAASVAVAINNGARIIRVHDVDAMKQVALVADAIINCN